MHGYHVGIALHHVDTILLGDGFLRLIEAVELALLVVDFRIGRVDVLLLYAFGSRVEQTASEGHHPTTHVQPGEYHAPGISVVEALLALDAKTCLLQILRLKTSLLPGEGQGVALRYGIAQIKLLDDIVTDTTTTEILLADGDSVRVVLQQVVKVVHGPLVEDEHRLTVALFFLLLVSQFLLLNLNIVFLRQPAQRLRIGNLLVLHQEVDGRATLATRKTLTDLLRWRHHERGRRVVVERAQTLIVHTRLSKRHELSHHVDNVRGIHNLVYRRPVNHFLR